MWTVRKSKKSLFALLFVCLLWLATGSSSQAEMMYRISDSELTQLERNLNQLEKNNETKQQLLTEQQTQLTEANKQLETVKKQLTESKTLNVATQKSLETANQSLRQLEVEAKRKVRVKTRQRNVWIGFSAALFYMYIEK